MSFDNFELAVKERISDVLFGHPVRTFGSLAPLSSNVRAVEACLRFSAGLVDLVAVVGPSGWGKSHLLEVVANRMSVEMETPINVLSAANFIAQTGREHSPVLILDDVQEVFGKKRQSQHLHLLLERRVRSRKPTLLAFSANTVSLSVRSFLPGSRDWQYVNINQPGIVDRRMLCTRLAMSEGLDASPALIEIVARHMHGNGRTLTGAFKRLRLSGAMWTSPDATLRACGLLTPFFADNPEWDLALVISRTAEARATHFPRVNFRDLAIYTMLSVAGLGELEVARYVDIAPGDAYHRSRQFAATLASDGTVARVLAQFVEMVVLGLATED